MQVRYAALDTGVRLPYVEQGDPGGIPLLLVHAIGDSWRSFERVLTHLPASLRALAVTQRGHGEASRPADGYRPGDFAHELAAFLSALGIEAAIVAGGSSGGVVARCLAIDHPERALGLVMLGSPLTLRGNAAARELWDSTLSTLTDPVDADLVREFVMGTLSNPVPQAYLDAMVEESLKVPAFVWRATFEGLMEDGSSEYLHKIRARTLILWGDRDELLPRSDQEAMAAAIPDARLVVYDGAGHVLYWEEPERVAADLAAFVSDVAGQR